MEEGGAPGDDGARYDPLSPAHRADPGAAFARLRTGCPVHHDTAHDLWVLTRHADVLAAAHDPATFSNRTSASGQLRPCPAAAEVLAGGVRPVDTLLTLDPPAHTEIRRIVNEAFKPSRVAALEPMVRAIAAELADALDTGGPVEVMEALAVPLPMRVISRVLGVPEAEFPTFKRWSDDIAGGLSADLPCEEQVRAARSRLAFYDYVVATCEERRRDRRDDVLSDLATLRRADGSRLTDAELCSIAVQLLVAGNETSTNLLGSVLLHLDRGGWWPALVADPGLAPAVVEETLRLESPVQALYRRTTRDVAVAGTTIPAGSRVHLVWASANRDPDAFADPDRFDPARAELRTHLAFGFGAHYCPGAPLARLEGRVALEELAARYPRLEVDQASATWRAHFHLRGLTRLLVRVGRS
jgi:cytochrome P450